MTMQSTPIRYYSHVTPMLLPCTPATTLTHIDPALGPNLTNLDPDPGPVPNRLSLAPTGDQPMPKPNVTLIMSTTYSPKHNPSITLPSKTLSENINKSSP